MGVLIIFLLSGKFSWSAATVFVCARIEEYEVNVKKCSYIEDKDEKRYDHSSCNRNLTDMQFMPKNILGLQWELNP